MENTPSQDFNAHNDKEEDYSYKIVKTIIILMGNYL